MVKRDYDFVSNNGKLTSFVGGAASVHSPFHPLHPPHLTCLAGEDEEEVKGRKRNQEEVFLGRNSE